MSVRPVVPQCYAGIGARVTPEPVLGLAAELAAKLASAGWVLRTGGADGADKAFQAGAERAGGRVDLFLPWPGFQRLMAAELVRPLPAAFEIAAHHHPAWGALSRGGRALQARNSHQILGRNLDAACQFVVCWTPDGSLDGATRSSGGTGQALRVAVAHNVPVLNLARPDHLARVERFLRGARGDTPTTGS